MIWKHPGALDSCLADITDILSFSSVSGEGDREPPRGGVRGEKGVLFGNRESGGFREDEAGWGAQGFGGCLRGGGGNIFFSGPKLHTSLHDSLVRGQNSQDVMMQIIDSGEGCHHLKIGVGHKEGQKRRDG